MMAGVGFFWSVLDNKVQETYINKGCYGLRWYSLDVNMAVPLSAMRANNPLISKGFLLPVMFYGA